MKWLPIFFLALALNSLAVEKCQSDDIYCGLDPFAPAVLALSEVCSERRPENKKYYQAAVSAVFQNHQKAFEQLGTDIEFQEDLRKFKENRAKQSKKTLDFNCESILAMGRDAMQQDWSKK